MIQNKSDVVKTRLTIFVIGSLVIAFLCAVIFIFMVAQQPDSSHVLSPSVNEQNNSQTSQKWH